MSKIWTECATIGQILHRLEILSNLDHLVGSWVGSRIESEQKSGRMIWSVEHKMLKSLEPQELDDLTIGRVGDRENEMDHPIVGTWVAEAGKFNGLKLSARA